VRHNVIEKAICLPRIDQCQDMRMLELCRETDLAQEPLGAEDGGKLRAEHLERDGAVVLEILGEVHRGHPTATELALDSVMVRQRNPQSRRDFYVHRRIRPFTSSNQLTTIRTSRGAASDGAFTIRKRWPS